MILCTISSGIRFDDYLGFLKLNGILVNVGAPDEPVTMVNWAFVPARRSYASSSSGGIPDMCVRTAFAQLAGRSDSALATDERLAYGELCI